MTPIMKMKTRRAAQIDDNKVQQKQQLQPEQQQKPTKKKNKKSIAKATTGPTTTTTSVLSKQISRDNNDENVMGDVSSPTATTATTTKTVKTTTRTIGSVLPAPEQFADVVEVAEGTPKSTKLLTKGQQKKIPKATKQQAKVETPTVSAATTTTTWTTTTLPVSSEATTIETVGGASQKPSLLPKPKVKAVIPPAVVILQQQQQQQQLKQQPTTTSVAAVAFDIDAEEEPEELATLDEYDEMHAEATTPTTPTSRIPIRTLKAEKRAAAANAEAVALTEPNMSSSMSQLEAKIPVAKSRAFINAEKRASWRAARLRSLEQGAVEAQNVIKNMNKIADDLLTQPVPSEICSHDGDSTRRLMRDIERILELYKQL